MTSGTVQKFSLVTLKAMAVGSMVGPGVFSLSQAFDDATVPFGAIITCCIAGGGSMYLLARVFQAPGNCKPDLESASNYSRFAWAPADAGRAAVMSFACVSVLMVLVTLASFALLARPEMAGIDQPMMAGVLAAVIGPWGAVFIRIGPLSPCRAPISPGRCSVPNCSTSRAPAARQYSRR